MTTHNFTLKANMTYLAKSRELIIISALLHDIGKSNKAFQKRLMNGLRGGDYYRHEFLSLKIFMLMIEDCQTDHEWLCKLSICDKEAVFDTQYIKENIYAQTQDYSFEIADISKLPPLAQWVAWLIVTHHRLPPSINTQVHNKKKQKEKLLRQFKINTGSEKAFTSDLYASLYSFDYWQKNPIVAEKDPDSAALAVCFDSIVIDSCSWQASISKYAKQALSNPLLFSDTQCLISSVIDDPFLLHMSRLLLVLSDHNYSSLGDDNMSRRVSADDAFSTMYANSNYDSSIRQSLDEHLIGVALFADKLTSSLANTMANLPALKDAPTLSTNTTIDRFAWQNKAYELAKKNEGVSKSNGFFCVNLASTGCGKTICNARIARALSETDGTRFTVALGLRTLTLQTGESFRKDLNLDASDLAIMVGGEANTELYKMNQQAQADKYEIDELDLGSESIDISLSDNVDSDIDISLYDGLDTLLSNEKSKQMLLSPLMVCTIDHIIQASEGLHGGNNIVPSLRLLSGDLVLDEPDDFGVEDLYALSRLVFTAGMYGSRVVLSSATLTPSMVGFLFDAYWSGRNLYNINNSLPANSDLQVPCMFVDEQDCVLEHCSNSELLSAKFNDFTDLRCTYLEQLPARRSAEIMPIPSLMYMKDFPEMFYLPLAQIITDQAKTLHDRYHEVDKSGKRISVGLIRFAYTKSVIATAKQLASGVEVPQDTHIHFCCYHSRNLLAMRNELENKLDRLLKRSNSSVLLADKPLFAEGLSKSDCTNHIFIVLATPIAEVGRDHDYDWAIVEPSSMRSIIQLAGRVWRHRPNKTVDKPNIAIMQYNLNYFTRQQNSYGDQKGIFTAPGFESADNKPRSYDLNELLSDAELSKIDSRARLVEGEFQQPAHSLSQLEHNRIMLELDRHRCCLANSVWHYTSRMYNLCTDVYILTKFRDSDDGVEHEYTIQLDDGVNFYIKKDLVENGAENADLMNHILVQSEFESVNEQVSLWLHTDIQKVASRIQQHRPNASGFEVLTRYFTVTLKDKVFLYHNFLGFYHA